MSRLIATVVIAALLMTGAAVTGITAVTVAAHRCNRHNHAVTISETL